jgi:hypothetical protein
MIRGMHAMFYSSQAEALRAFLKDKLGLSGVDVGDGWLIFNAPEADLGVHPTEGCQAASGTAEISFYCDDIAQTVAELRARGVEFTQDVEDHGYGFVTYFAPAISLSARNSAPRHRVNLAAANGRRATARCVIATDSHRPFKPGRQRPFLEECTMKRLQRASAPIVTQLTGIALLGVAGGVFAHDDGIQTRLKSYQEVPAVSSTATGRFKAWIDEKAGTVKYELSYNGLEGDVRQAHIHFGQRSVNGAITVWLCQTSFNVDPTGGSPTCPQSGTVSGMFTAANVLGPVPPAPAGQGIQPGEFAELVAAIRAGAAYANVHSSKFPGGELRGQLRDDD